MKNGKVKETAITLIIIDDDPAVIYYHKALLERWSPNALIHNFSGVNSALNFLENHAGGSEKNCIVLLDLNMPVYNGWDFLSKVEKLTKSPSLHIFIVTSSINESDKTRASNHPLVKGYFIKPLENNDLKHIASQISQLVDSM